LVNGPAPLALKANMLRYCVLAPKEPFLLLIALEKLRKLSVS